MASTGCCFCRLPFVNTSYKTFKRVFIRTLFIELMDIHDKLVIKLFTFKYEVKYRMNKWINLCLSHTMHLIQSKMPKKKIKYMLKMGWKFPAHFFQNMQFYWIHWDFQKIKPFRDQRKYLIDTCYLVWNFILGKDFRTWFTKSLWERNT